MANKSRFILNTRGVGDLLKSAELQRVLGERAAEIAARAGTGYESDTKLMGTRVIASVYTADAETAREDAENDTLLKAVF